MRIIAGYLKSRQFEQPPLVNTRPTSDRVRESIFNMINHQLLLQNQTFAAMQVLDVFAGSGAMGFEAASRGSTLVLCIDNHSAAVKTLYTNTSTLNLQNKVKILRYDALKLPAACQQFTLIFLDPPYGQDLISKTLNVLQANNWIANQALVVCESGLEDVIRFDKNFTVIAERRFSHCQINIICFNKLD